MAARIFISGPYSQGDVALNVRHAVLRLPGEGVGADKEVERARYFGIKFFKSVSALRKWIDVNWIST